MYFLSCKAPFSLYRFKVPVHPNLIRDEPCHNPDGTVDNLGDPGWTVLNRLMSLVVLKCLKQPGVTGKYVKYRGKLGRRREQPCLHRDSFGMILVHSGNILVFTVINCAPWRSPGMPDFFNNVVNLRIRRSLIRAFVSRLIIICSMADTFFFDLCWCLNQTP